MIRLTFAAAFLAAFGAAAAFAQTPAQNIVSGMLQCISPLLSEPDVPPLLMHIPLNIGAATPQQLADTSYPTPQEAATITRITPRLRACREMALAQLTVLAPTIGAIFQQDATEQKADAELLKQRAMSYGSYVSRGKQRSEHYRVVAQNEVARLQGIVQQRQQAVAAQNFITGLAKLAIGAAVVAAASQPQYVAPPVGLTIQRPVTCAQTGSVNAIVRSVTCY